MPAVRDVFATDEVSPCDIVIVVLEKSLRLNEPDPVRPVPVVISTKPFPTCAPASLTAVAIISEACRPSNKSASSPEPAPSFVISKKPSPRISAAVLSAVALSSIPSN